jgi:hypothetical protein
VTLVINYFGLLLRLITLLYFLDLRGPPTFGNRKGSFNFAIQWFTASGLDSFHLARSVAVGALTLQPSSAKYA